MKLNLTERFTLLGLLPAQGDFSTLKIMRKFREDLSTTEDEIKAFGIVQIGDQVKWNPKFAENEVEILIGEMAMSIIEKLLKDLDDTKKLANQHFTLYEKFIVQQT